MSLWPTFLAHPVYFPFNLGQVAVLMLVIGILTIVNVTPALYTASQ